MRILLAEDDPDMQKILKLYLEKEGYEVHVVSNGMDAIDFLSEHPGKDPDAHRKEPDSGRDPGIDLRSR